jgi:DNA invertase Pin-like site-specific DNA recombinase
MKFSIMEEERRRKISRGTKAALAVRKAQGVKLGGLNAQSIRNRDEARERAEVLRPLLVELAGMPTRAIARELTARGVRLPCGARWPWHAMTVIRAQRRLKGKHSGNLLPPA